METPTQCEVHQKDYAPQAWENYTIAELASWVELLVKRAGHRVPGEKRRKDLYDARNYAALLSAKIEGQITAQESDTDGD